MNLKDLNQLNDRIAALEGIVNNGLRIPPGVHFVADGNRPEDRSGACRTKAVDCADTTDWEAACRKASSAAAEWERRFKALQKDMDGTCRTLDEVRAENAVMTELLTAMRELLKDSQ